MKWQTVRKATLSEKLIQTVVCIVSGFITAAAALAIANGAYSGHYVNVGFSAIALIVAFAVFVKHVIGWGIVVLKNGGETL